MSTRDDPDQKEIDRSSLAFWSWVFLGMVPVGVLVGDPLGTAVSIALATLTRITLWLMRREDQP